ncbi:MAG: hypothetical protein MRQ13_03550 [Candidatus Midichloria sp.]|nr:hypothetical protein [Candidatus Midichloria sp.]
MRRSNSAFSGFVGCPWLKGCQLPYFKTKNMIPGILHSFYDTLTIKSHKIKAEGGAFSPISVFVRFRIA